MSETKHTGPVVEIGDLDAILAKKVLRFKLHGKWHDLKNLSLEEFLLATEAQNRILQLAYRKEKFTMDEMLDKYMELTVFFTETISKDDLKNCTQAQITALFTLMTDAISGRLYSDEKKSLQKVKDLLR